MVIDDYEVEWLALIKAGLCMHGWQVSVRPKMYSKSFNSGRKVELILKWVGDTDTWGGYLEGSHQGSVGRMTRASGPVEERVWVTRLPVAGLLIRAGRPLHRPAWGALIFEAPLGPRFAPPQKKAYTLGNVHI